MDQQRRALPSGIGAHAAATGISAGAVGQEPQQVLEVRESPRDVARQKLAQRNERVLFDLRRDADDAADFLRREGDVLRGDLLFARAGADGNDAEGVFARLELRQVHRARPQREHRRVRPELAVLPDQLNHLRHINRRQRNVRAGQRGLGFDAQVLG